MRKIFTFSFLLGSFSMFGQESQFMGYVTPTVSNLIPASKNQVEPKNQVIKPNFKGRDLIEVDNTNTHNPDWVWQQHQS